MSLAVLAAAAGWTIASSPRVPARTAVVPNPASTGPVAPDDAIWLRHLFLAPQHGAALMACQAMADRLGFAVPCPDLLPSDAAIAGQACCVFGNPNVAPLFVFESHFTAPSGYPPAEASIGPPEGHLVIIAARRTPSSSALACQASISDGDGPTVWGAPSHWERCPGPGTNTGHLILEWDTGGIAYSVSLHGETVENRAAVALIAGGLTVAEPGR